jgi:hypothetical protein
MTPVTMSYKMLARNTAIMLNAALSSWFTEKAKHIGICVRISTNWGYRTGT